MGRPLVCTSNTKVYAKAVIWLTHQLEIKTPIIWPVSLRWFQTFGHHCISSILILLVVGVVSSPWKILFFQVSCQVQDTPFCHVPFHDIKVIQHSSSSGLEKNPTLPLYSLQLFSLNTQATDCTLTIIWLIYFRFRLLLLLKRHNNILCFRWQLITFPHLLYYAGNSTKVSHCKTIQQNCQVSKNEPQDGWPQVWDSVYGLAKYLLQEDFSVWMYFSHTVLTRLSIWKPSHVIP